MSRPPNEVRFLGLRPSRMLRRITLQVAGMNRRLRKKTHRGEFTQYGFGLVVLLRMDPENDLLARRVAANNFLDRVIVEAERLGLRVAVAVMPRATGASTSSSAAKPACFAPWPSARPC